MKRAIPLLIAGVVAGVPAPAWADKVITAGTPNRYTTPEVTMDQGERLTFRNDDFARHDVVATKTDAQSRPLFRTDLLGQGEEAFVEGSQYLTTGAYDFICSVHGNMKGTLTVSAAGTPATRPGATTPGNDLVRPKLTLSLVTKKLSAARKGIVVKVGANEAVTGTIGVVSGRTTVARGKLTRDAAGSGRATLKLTTAGKKLIARGRSISVRVSVRAKDGAGNAATKTAGGRLSR